MFAMWLCEDNMRCSHAASIELPGDNDTVQVAQKKFQDNKQTCVTPIRALVWLELLVYLAVSSILWASSNMSTDW